MGIGAPWFSLQPALRFALLFVVHLLILSQVFDWIQDFFVNAYMYPVARMATALLNLIGVAVELDSSMLRGGFCDLGQHLHRRGARTNNADALACYVEAFRPSGRMENVAVKSVLP